MVAGGLALGTGQVISQGCSFVRNAIVANLISPADFGIAATFWITIALLDMLSNMNVEALIVQSPVGGRRRFQDTAHLVMALRGMGSAVVLFVIAWPMAHVFRVPQALWAFQCLAFYPLMRAYLHQDINRFQREMKFTPSIIAEVSSQLITMFLAWPMAVWSGNYAALLWLVLLQMAIYVVLSHVLAERPYRWGWRRSYGRRIFAFGWPMVIGGMLFCLVTQGDQFIIGSAGRYFSQAQFDMQDLGIYSLAVMVASMSTVLLAKVHGTLTCPLLARSANHGQYLRRYQSTTEGLAFVSGVVAVWWIVAGRAIIGLVYGSAYLPPRYVFELLAGAQAVRLIRIGPGMAALSLGDTHNSMWAVAFRALWVGGALFAAARGGGLVWIAACALFGEIAAFLSSTFYLHRRHKVPLSMTYRPTVHAALWVIVATGLMYSGLNQWGSAGAGLFLSVIILLMLLTTMLLFEPLRYQVGMTITALRERKSTVSS